MTIASNPFAEEIAPQLEADFLKLNPEQRKVVAHDHGPLLVIAGPGSGKTHCLTLRAMNLLLLGKAVPSELVLCTYTEKAAYEMQDRVSEIAKRVGYNEDISQMRIGTIHGICSRIIMENLHRIPNFDQQRPFIGNNYEILDRLPQCLFIFEHLDMICETSIAFFTNRWGTKWNIVKQLQTYFDKITEELISIEELRSQQDTFLYHLANAYRIYQALLVKYNRVDFAHLQKIAYGLLKRPNFAEYITTGISYVLVDEYQDTNYIQEQILFMLSSKTSNICVVSDEDQSLYRFRGATVQNIRRFLQISHAHKDDVIYLKTNYRSHSTIIDTYNRWMSTMHWGQFRSDKQIQPQPEKNYPEYPAVLSIVGKDVGDEAGQFAEFVTLLKEQGKITDFNQVVLLLYSVKEYRSHAYVEALEKKGIPVFCSRDGTYFSQEEVSLMVGCLGQILNYSEGLLGEIVGNYRMNDYLSNAYSLLGHMRRTCTMLDTTLHEFELEIAQLTEGQKIHKQIVDYFYHLLAIEPFVTFLNDDKNKSKRQNLVVFSEFLQTFQSYYRYNEISFENCGKLTSDFFNKFLSLLYEDGINQYENPEQPFPDGHVPVITIHQAKGLEFPVVVVGSLDRGIPGSEAIDKQLQRFYRRSKPDSGPSILPEPDQDIPIFDFLRLYYVAFSRAMYLLILTGNLHKRPSPIFDKILRGLPQWRDVQSHLSSMPRFPANKWMVPKPRYSFTGHIRMYETCPRQYQFYREYKFAPSRPEDTFFGLLVHQTIEKIHHIILDGNLATLTETRLRELFDQTHYFLSQTNMHAIDVNEKEKAFDQMINYFINNLSEMQYITKAEEQVSVVKNDYVLTGVVDLVLERNGGLEILDLKTSRRPEPDYLEICERQLCLYAHALEQRDGKVPERLLLYWTQEPHKEDALMVFPYHAERVEEVVAGFDDIVDCIKAKQFSVVAVPEAHVCKKCDVRNLCIREGLIERC